MDLCTNTVISTNILLGKKSKLQSVTYNVVPTVLKITRNNLTCFLLGHIHACDCTEEGRPAPTDPSNYLQVGRRGGSGQRILDFLPITLQIFARKKSMVFVLLK